VSHNLHWQIARDCLDAGLHLQVQKPIALTIAERRRIIYAREKGRAMVVSEPSVLGRRTRAILTALGNESLVGTPTIAELHALITAGSAPISSGEQALEALAMVYACLEAATTGRPTMVADVLSGVAHAYEDTIEAARLLVAQMEPGHVSWLGTRPMTASCERIVKVRNRTALGYGEGRSEELMGVALNGLRSRVAVATKTAWKGPPRSGSSSRWKGRWAGCTRTIWTRSSSTAAPAIYFQVGADLVLVRPVWPRVLVAYIQMLLRRVDMVHLSVLTVSSWRIFHWIRQHVIGERSSKYRGDNH
jgi:hypothetical protein